MSRPWQFLYFLPEPQGQRVVASHLLLYADGLLLLWGAGIGVACLSLSVRRCRQFVLACAVLSVVLPLFWICLPHILRLSDRNLTSHEDRVP